MESIKYGRKIFSFGRGTTVLTSLSITEKPLSDEGERTFIRRLLKKYEGQEGTIEIVFKNGKPDYAIVTLCC